MSGGPIAAAREAWKPPVVSTADKDRVCAAGTGLNVTLGKAYCGRKADKFTVADWGRVTCADCQAARRADEAAEVAS